MTLDRLSHARAVADAVLYEGYVLYPYRATARKNQVRWQFGILGPVGAAAAGVGEDATMRVECLLETSPDTTVDVRLRFLQVQARTVEEAVDESSFAPVPELSVGTASWLPWEEAVEREANLPDLVLAELSAERIVPVEVPGGEDVEMVRGEDGVVAGRLVRRREPLTAQVRVSAEVVDARVPLTRLRVSVENTTDVVRSESRGEAVRRSQVGAHLLLAARNGSFVSLLEPPEEATAAAAACANHRCWPVLVGEEGRRDVMLASPIILYDYPAVAPESAGDMFDSTEIDEILTLRVMTLTDEEKVAARATDPRAAAIIDRCDTMSPAAMEALHGTLRYPHQPATDLSPDLPTDVPHDLGGLLQEADVDAAQDPEPDWGGSQPWWDPGADASVSPATDAVRIAGVPVAKGSKVRLRPSRRADAQDLFLADQTATVTAVLSDVDGNTHVAVVLTDDPASDLHEWYGRYLYFAPDEIEPLTPEATS